MDETFHLEDEKLDILSHSARGNTIHILTLDPALATDVYERIENDPVFQQMDISGIYDRQSFDSADHKKIEQLIESSVIAFFKDLDLQDWEIQYLQDLAEEVGEPLYELIDFYLAPQTILQKIRRLWRVQRISVKALKLIAKTAELGQPPTRTFSHFTKVNETTLNY